MDSYKLEEFAGDHPGQQYPWVESVQPQEAQRMVSELMSRFCPSATNASDFIHFIAEQPMLEEITVLDDEFDFTRLLIDAQIRIPQEILVNFAAFEQLERMRYAEFAKHFRYVYWPATDDLDCFDESLEWIVSIDHDGRITVLKHPV